MSKSDNFSDLKKLFRGYRIKIHCFNCNEIYITNLIHKLKMPRRCKYCGSIKIEPVDYWKS